MTPPEGTQSIIRALHVLKCFDDVHPRWELQDLTHRSGLNKTTLFRILGALESEGLLERLSDGRYTLGSEAIALGGRAARVNNLRAVSHKHLQHLTEVTEETTTLEVLRPESDDTWSMLVIDEVLGRYRIGITPYIGSRLPVNATSTGKAVLAFLDESVQQKIIQQQFSRFTEKTLHTSDALQEELALVRQQGFSVAFGELEAGLVAIGAPIFDTNGKVTSAISLVGPSVRINKNHIETLAAFVCEEGAQISYALGYRPVINH